MMSRKFGQILFAITKAKSQAVYRHAFQRLVRG